MVKVAAGALPERSARLLAWATVLLVVAGSVGLSATPADAAMPTAGLAGYWDFDENGGTVAADSSGNNQNGTLTPSTTGGPLPLWDSANMAPVFGNVSSLDFSDGGFVNVPEQPPGDNPLDANTVGPNNDNLTLASWIYVDSSELTNGNNSIIRKGDTSSREYGMDLIVTSPTDIKLRSFVNSTATAGGTADIDPGSANIPTNQWVHVSMTYDGTQVTGYINAVADGPGSAGSGDIFDNNSSVRIGGQTASSGGGAIPFRGNLDEVRVYNRALTTTELAMLAGDTDGDGVQDANDNCPEDFNDDQADNEPDGEGDVCDEDDDNDGTPDTNDEFPFDPDETNDNDDDTIGDNADPDDDNDGQSDADENTCGSDPLDAGSTSPDQDGDGSPDCVDPDDDGDGIPDTAPPTNKDQCKKNGWMSFNNPAFKNQGDCVAFVSTQGRNPPSN